VNGYPILTRTLVVVIPSCTLVPLGGLLLGALLAAILLLAVTA
jgi:hypothetical protein